MVITVLQLKKQRFREVQRLWPRSHSLVGQVGFKPRSIYFLAKLAQLWGHTWGVQVCSVCMGSCVRAKSASKRFEVRSHLTGDSRLLV